MAFRCDSSPLQEMQRLETLRQRDPQSAAAAVANGKLLVEWARDGRLRELQCALQHLDSETRVLLFYAVRMFRVACHARRLDVLRFMLANGFDLQQTCMRDVLHGVVEAIDTEAEAEAEAAQPLVRFLLDAGVDVNWQRQGDLRTALHIACAKNLYAIAYLLILYDADVNAIAADEEMPLASAERMAMLGRAPTTADGEQNGQLLALLHDCGARRSWRRTNETATACGTNANGSATAPRMLSFSASMTLCPASGEDRDEDGALATAFAEGIQLDTPASPW